MNQVLLCSVSYIKNFSTFDLNLDDTLITSTIKHCTDKFITPIIGSGLMNEIILQVSSSTLSNQNQNLLNLYIQQALAAYVVYEVSDWLLYKFNNKSISKDRSETSEPISLPELKYLKDRLLDTAQYYGTKVSNYLLANQNTFPLYVNAGNSIDTVQPKRDTDFSNGIITSRNLNRRCNFPYGNRFSDN